MRPIPSTIRLAVSLMLIIAVVQLAGMSLGFMAADEMREKMASAYSSDETFSAGDADAMVRQSLIEGIVLTVLLSAVWIWMAIKYRSGRNWARITGTVLFLLFTPLLALGLLVLTNEAPGSLNPGEHMPIAIPAVNIAMWVLALATVVLSWTPSANRHFRKKHSEAPAFSPPHPGT